MNRTRAKLILGSCLPGGNTPDDPLYREALAFAESDPELRRWLEELQAFDSIIVSKLQEMSPPSDLLDTILIGCHPEIRPRRWTSRFGYRGWVIPLAAAVLLLFGIPLYLQFSRESNDASGFRSAAARFLSTEWDHQFTSDLHHFPEIQRWATALPEPQHLEIPANLETLETYGCRVFQWHGQTAMLVCFISKSNGEIIHVISVRKVGISDGPIRFSGGTLEMAQVGEWNSAAWVHGDRLYIAFSKLDPTALAQELGTVNL